MPYLITCPQCGQSVTVNETDDVSFCPTCGLKVVDKANGVGVMPAPAPAPAPMPAAAPMGAPAPMPMPNTYVPAPAPVPAIPPIAGSNGLSIQILSAIACLAALFGGYVFLGILVGYVILKEENDWLRRNVVKVLVLSLFFDLLIGLLKLIPGFIGLIQDAASIGNAYINLGVFNSVMSFIYDIIYYAEKIIVLILFFMSFGLKTIRLPLIDSLLDKHFSNKAA